jgi:hypothetical protein
MRDPDHRDVDLVLRLYELRRETEMRKARAWVLSLRPETLEQALAPFAPDHPENAHFRQMTSYWEMVADFANRGLLHPEMFAAHCGEAFFLFAKFEPHLEGIRATGRTRFLLQVSKAVNSHPACRERLDGVRQVLATMQPARAPAAPPGRPAH